MSIQQKALHDAIDRLQAIGATFKIITKEGKEHGTLKLAPPVAEKPARRRYLPIFREKLDALKVGEVAELDAGDFPAENFRAAAMAHLIFKYKPGCATSTVRGKKIEILRLR